MSTKALLLAAAAVAAVASSHAQVYSVNAVGYVNTTLKPGYNLVSNPLNAADNSMGNLFKNMQGGVPDGTTLYKFQNGGFVTATYDQFAGGFDPAEDAAVTVVPGEGLFVFIPNGSGDKVVTFVGEVSQGPTSTPIPRGFSIKSSVVPQAVKPDALGAGSLPAADGDTLYRYSATTKQYTTYSYDQFGGWSPELPVINVGEAFYYFRLGAATTWNRTFSVNNPS
jgi:hypothetical protein